MEDISEVSIQEIQQILNENADLLNHGKGNFSKKAKRLLSTPARVLSLPFIPVIGLGFGIFASFATERFWEKLGVSLAGLAIGTLLTPVFAFAVAYDVIESAICLPLAVLTELPRYAFSKKYRQEVKLTRNLQKLKECYKLLINQNNQNEYSNFRLRQTLKSLDIRTLISEIKMLNHELGRNTFINQQGDVVYYSYTSDKKENPTHSDIIEVSDYSTIDTQNDYGRDL